MIWLFVGIIAGLLNGLLRVWTVSKVKPNVEYSMWSVVMRGLFVRLGLVATVLTLAVRQNAISGLFAFLGFWVTRWFFVYWVHQGRMNWVWKVAAILESR